MRLRRFQQKARLSAASAIDQLRRILASQVDGAPARRLDLSELEDRILLSVSPAAVMAESAPSVEVAEVASPLETDAASLFETSSATADVSSSDSIQNPDTSRHASDETLSEPSSLTDLDEIASQILAEQDSPSEQAATEVVFVDEAAEDYEQLIADLQAQREAGRAVDYFVLEADSDGVDQIAETLQRYSNLDAVHIVSHGTDGAVKLGSAWLRIGSLDGYAGEVAGWGNALAENGDLLFYGCDLAASSRGELLVDSIAALTGADVAASTDDTGSALRGGDWDLEFHSGQVQTSVAFSETTQENWSGLLATVAITDFLDSDGEPRASTQSSAPTGGLPVPDFDGDGRDGRTIQKDNGSYNTSASTKFQLWRTDNSGFLVDGNVSFTLYSAMIDFATDKAGDVRVYLTETDTSGNNQLGSPLASATITTAANTWSGGWDQDVVNFGTITRFIEPGRALAVKITVGTGADGDMMFAYDTASTPSSLDYDTMTSGVPNLSNLNGDTLNYIEDDGAVVIDQGAAASITDGDSPDFDGGLLYVSITSGGNSGEDVLSVRNQGGGSGQVGFSGGTVTYEGTAIGTATGGTTGTPLRIALNANANATSVGALTRNVTYENLDTGDPSTTSRSVNFFLHDGDGGVSSSVNATVTVTAQNDAPVLDTGGTMSLTTIEKNDSDPVGDTVAAIVASAGGDRITDADGAVPEGIAVTNVVDTNGTWEYSTNGGTNWNSFASAGVAPNSAVLLNTAAKIRFVPNPGYFGSGGGVTFHAWDQTFGSNGQTGVNIPSIGTGGTNPFSLNSRSASILVNDPPTTSGISNVSATEDDPNLDIDLFPSFADSEDSDSQLIYSVQGNTNPGLFTSVSIVSGRFARLNYAPDQSGSADITIRATDTAGSFVETTFNVDVTAVNDAPINSVPGNQATPQDTPLTFNTANGNLVSISDDDAGGASVEVTLNITNGTATLSLPAAAGTPTGAEALVTTTTGQIQTEPAIARAANGNYVVVWSGNVPDDADGIGFQIFDPNHNPIGTEQRANLTKTDAQFEPRVAMDDAGNFVLVWTSNLQDGFGKGVYARLFDNSGTATTGEILVNTYTTDDQNNPDVAMDADGDFVVVWESNGQDGNNEGVYGQRFNSSGVKVGGEFQVSTTTINKQYRPRVAMADSGRFVVIWEDSKADSGGPGVFGRRYDTSGNALDVSEFQVNTTSPDKQEHPDVAMDAAGNFVVVWASQYDSGLSRGVYGQLFDAAGNPTGPGEFLINSTVDNEQRFASVAMEADGDFVVVWESVNQDNPGDFLSGVYAQQFDSTGAAVGSEVLINSTVTGSQQKPAVAADPNGNFVVAWQGNGTGDGDGVFARRYSVPSPPLTFSMGDGAADSLMTFTGSITDINNALDGLIFTPNSGFSGLASLDITSDDLGNVGPGGALQDVDTININVTGGNAAPTITSNGGGATAAVNVAENTTAVTTVTASDTDLPAQTLTYSISGGTDQSLFSIDSGSGVLTFASARDFETPTDANTDNVYEVTVQVSDGVGGIDSQDISVTVTDVVEGNVVVVDTTSDVADGNTSSIGALLGNKGADGRISLREAILATNNTTNTGSPDEIHFNIADNDPGHFYYADDSTPGALLSLSTTTVGDGMIGDFDPDYPYAQHSWFTIDLNTALPELEITDAVIIDGYTQAGATVNTLSVGHNASLRIELTSTGADGNRGIAVLNGGDGSTIRGLAINGFDGSEIMVEPGADGVTIQGNFLGTDITGTKALGDGDAGVHLRSSNNLVGGPNVADRNLLSGNDSRGVTTFTFGPIESGNAIQNNYIGTDATGLNALGNSLAGLQVYNQDGLQILDNVISGNTGEGVWFRDISPSNANVIVQGNFIGVGADGTTVVANTGNGILADGPANSTTIGGSGVGEGNVIAGNTGDGIRLDGSGATGITIQGNAIGTDAGGTLNLGNGGHGILFRSNAQDNVVGGTLPGEGNTIAFNSGDGVAITQNGTDRNAIRGNAIFGNTGLGIDLNNDGVTNNDAGDGDGGPNLRQNFPVLSAASVSGSDLTVTGTLNSTAGTTFQIDFYANASADGSGHGEGERYLGSASVLTNGSGNATISELLSGASVSVGEFVTATATDPTGNTSEFALNAVAVSSNSPPTITSDGGGAAAAINVSENTTAVTTVTANDTDLPAQTLTYSISGGADQALFNIDSGSGVLTFVSAPDFETPTDANTDNIYHVTVQVSDGQGGTDSQNISVTVTPVNEAPVNTGPGLQMISADEPLVFSTANGNAVQISDVDAGSSPLQVTLAATNATLTLSGTTGLTFSTGDGTSDATMTFTGSLTSINSALEGLTLTPSPNFTGSASLQVTTNDQGNTGAGGSLGDSDNVSVTVNAVSLTPTNEFRVNSNTINVQETSSEARGSHRAVSIAPSGNYVVVWSSQSQDGSGFGVYGQRFNKNGVALGSEFQINQTTTSDQEWATVATDGAGNFVVAWSSQNQDGSGAGVYARRYDASGTALSGEFLVNTTTFLDQDSPSVAMADDGRFVVVWTGNGSGDSSGIFGRLYDRTGSAVGNEFLINTSTFGTQSDAAVAMNADGRFVAVWDDGGGFHGRRFDASGTPQGNQFNIDFSTSAGNGSVAMDSAGNFVATWRETIVDRAIFAQRYDSTGAAIGGQIGVNTTTLGDQTHPSVDVDEAGNFTIVWEGNGVGDANGVFGRKFDSSGTAIGAEFRINQTTTGGQQNASVALLDGDNFVVVWSGEGPGDTSGVFARQYSSGVNNAPTAGAGGPYVINEGDSLILNGAASSDPDSDPLSYAWDLDNDGNYGEPGEPTTVSPAVSWATLQSFGITDDGSFMIGLQVDDGNGGVDTATTMLTVNNVPPTITSSASVNVSENATTVLTVTATDPVDTVAYSLSGGVDQGLFTINPTTGALSFSAAPDFEAPADNDTNNVYLVEVTASDGDGGTDVQAISVGVTDLNDETPVITAAQSFNVSELAANGTSLGTVTATDADAGTTFSNWTITSGNVAGIFAINSSTGELTVADNTNLDFETSPGYVLSLTVSDGLNTSAVETVSIGVTDQNDNVPVIDAAQSFNVSESAANGTSLGTVTATDADAGTTFSNWTITSGNASGIFAINSSTGELTVADNANLDFESTPAYVLSLTVSDGTNTSSVETVSVSVLDANEAPSVSLSPTSSALSENADTSSAIVLAAISVTDDALGTNSLSLSGSDAADFEIVGGNLRLRAGTMLDFETKSTYNVTVEVNDPLVGSSPDDSQSFTLTINDVNDAPTTSGLPNVVVNEDSPNVPIDLTAAFSDAETASSLLTYTVVSNSNPTLFSGASSSGGTLTLNFAANSHGSSVITVQAADPAGATVSTSFTVNVLPVNDAPAAVSDSYNVTENTLVVPSSGGVLANDTDADGDSLTALLVTGPDHGSLVLLSNGGFTYTPDSAFSGTDSFVYRPFDGTTTGPARSVSLNVTRVVAPPPSTPEVETTSPESVETTESSESGSSTESTEGEIVETPVESAPAASEPVATSSSEQETEPEPAQPATEDDNDEELVGVFTDPVDAAAEFFNSESDRLELRDASNVRMASVTLEGPTGESSVSGDSLRSSLRFDDEDLSYLVSTEFIQELEQVQDEFAFDAAVPEWAAGTAVATTGLSVGYIMWMLRGGYVLASVLSTMPVWQNVDPLPVLAALDDADDGNDESLESMIDRASSEADQSDNAEGHVAEGETDDDMRKEELV